MKKHIKKIISLAACITAATSITMFSVGCDNGNGPEKDGFDIDTATPVNTYTYDIPQDYCRTYYEVFVHSFADSDGDGIGDIRGLIDNLDYLNDGDDSTTSDLGINGIWLMPIHQSPSYHKYDVTDYYSIDSEYGTMSDFEDLVKACDERDIWLQMDLVLNHTSTQHKWFKDAVKEAQNGLYPEDPEAKAMQKYSFVRTEDKPTSGKWHSVSGTDLWYLGNFDSGMPDVNLSNTAVRAEIENIVDFWLEKGVRSFRLDAVPWAYADSVSYNPANGEFWTWFNDYCDEKGREVYGERYPDLPRYCYNVGEVLELSGDVTLKYFETGMSNFDFSRCVNSSGLDTYLSVASNNESTLTSATGLVLDVAINQSMLLDIADYSIASNVISNHDMDRWATSAYLRNSLSKIKTAAGLYLLMPGNPYIYYGEEIGATGSKGGSDTDANRRLHFNWGDSRATQDPPGANYSGKQRFGSMLDQTDDKDSILTYYRQAIRLRNRFPEIGRGVMKAYAVDGDGKLVKTDTLGAASGLVGINALNKTVAAYTLEYKGSETLIVHNVGDGDAAIDLSEFGGYDVVGAVKANGGRVVVRDGKLHISGGISAVLKIYATE